MIRLREDMMVGRYADFEDSQIIEAGEALRRQGKRATPNAIRTAMGGGNLRRIREIWDRHAEMMGHSEGAPSADDLPDRLREALNQEVGGLREQAQEDAERLVRGLLGAIFDRSPSRIFQTAMKTVDAQYDGLVERYKNRINDLEQVIEDAIAANESADGQVTALTSQVEQQAADLAKREQEIERLQAELARVNEKYAADMAREQEKATRAEEAHQARERELEEKRDAALAEVKEVQRQAKADAEAAEQRRIEEAQRLQAALADQQKASEQLRSELGAAQQEAAGAADARERLRNTEAQLQTVTERMNRAENEAAEGRAAKAELEGTRSSLRAMEDALKDARAERDRMSGLLQATLPFPEERDQQQAPARKRTGKQQRQKPEETPTE